MAIKIIKEGKLLTTVCSKCKSTLSYTEGDIRTCVSHYRLKRRYIICPKCEFRVFLSEDICQ